MTSALVIGAGGGLGSELVRQLAGDERVSQVFAVTRDSKAFDSDKVRVLTCDHTDSAIHALCQQLKGQHIAQVFCCIGTLHSEHASPEKRLEDISEQALLHVLRVNTVVPALWLKHLAPLVKGETPATVVLFSARVGSISDNQLGGWYSYRASKAALNMLVKTAQVEYGRRAKNVTLVCYHPGTVDTGLSKPFQSNVPQGKLFTPEYSIQQLRSHLADLSPEQGPYYIDWQGKNIPW